MNKKIRKLFESFGLARQIRISMLGVLIPLVFLLIIVSSILLYTNKNYENMIRSAIVASEFSLDFKKDFDDETYLLIVGNKTKEDSGMDALLSQAEEVENQLMDYANSQEDMKRIKAIARYLDNLKTYKTRIENNLSQGNKYEENMLIWENDVQIVSSLLQETMSEYIYYEIKDLQTAQDKFRNIYLRIVVGIMIVVLIIVIATIFLSVYLPRSISKPIEKKVTEEQTRLRKAELELLQSQINPHFLYNTLDTIVWAAEDSDQKLVVSMVKSLSEFFRTSLNSGKEIVTIEEEIAHASSYLQIQRIRYRDILEYSIDIPKEVYSSVIPKITIQPLIENALYHGIKNKRGMGKITVTGDFDEKNFRIYVQDNGKGMTEDRLKKVNEKIKDNTQAEGEIFGLSNVNERIALKFGKEYGISVESELDVGTKVTVTLPR